MMRHGFAAIAAGLCLATLTSTGSDASNPAPEQTSASACKSEEAPSVEVVLLVDQSQSLENDLPQIQRAIEQVGNRLLVEVQDGQEVKFGVAKFGETASTVRELSPLRIGESFTELGLELSNGKSLEAFTDYILGLNEAIRMFDSGNPDACKVLLWFTDGMFDLAPLDLGVSSAFEENAEANALTSAVCGNDGQIARSIGSRGITTFAVLLKNQSAKKWNDWYLTYPNLRAGLSSMQAITGDPVIDDLPINDYQQDEACEPITTENAGLEGEVLVGGGQLAGILSMGLGDAFGAGQFRCPEEVPISSSRLLPDEGMPPGLILSNVYVTAVAGEIGSVSAVLPDGGPQLPLRLSSVDNRLDRAGFRAFPSGWKLAISNSGESELKVCIQYDETSLPPAELIVSPSPATVVNGVGTEIELTVDWSQAFDEVDPAGLVESWELSGDGLDVASGPLTDPDSVAVVTVFENDDADAFELTSVELMVTLQGTDQQVTYAGQIEPPIQVRTDADRPRLECSASDNNGFGELKVGGPGAEVTKGERYASPGTCTVFPPQEVDPDTGVGYVTVTFGGTADLGMPWELQAEDGVAIPTPFRVEVGDEPVALRVGTSSGLESKEYIGSGSFTLRTEWSRHPAGGNGPDYSQEAAFDFNVELIPPHHTRWALIITLIVTAIAMLFSLVLLRLMNHLLVRIPEPSAFYFRVVPVRISPDPVSGASWSPTGDGFTSDSRPVAADSPGRDLKAGPLRVHRSLGPVWKPFSPPFSRLKGDRVIRSTPSGRRHGTAPVAFPSLTALMSSGDERSADGSFPAQIVVLYPRRHEFDETQVRQDVDRLVGPVWENIGQLTPDMSDVAYDDSTASGKWARPQPSPEPASRGAGAVAPPSRSGPPSGPALDTAPPDRSLPRREPPRREPPPRSKSHRHYEKSN